MLKFIDAKRQCQIEYPQCNHFQSKRTRTVPSRFTYIEQNYTIPSAKHAEQTLKLVPNAFLPKREKKKKKNILSLLNSVVSAVIDIVVVFKSSHHDMVPVHRPSPCGWFIFTQFFWMTVFVRFNIYPKNVLKKKCFSIKPPNSSVFLTSFPQTIVLMPLRDTTQNHKKTVEKPSPIDVSVCAFSLK